jgi:DNA polymerase-3 subunit gamma/tau
MTVQNTVNHLKGVAEKEGIRYEEAALAVIAEKADGGMRDALSIFDQAASFCQGDITYQKVIEDLNVLDAEYYFRLVDLSLENKVSEAMVLLNDIINKGFDGGLLVQGLAKHVRNVLMARDSQTLSLLEVSDQQRQRYQEQAKRCPVTFLYKALEVMNRCDINYRQSSNKRLLVELTLIEVAQITQPDDAPGSGRKPRRLKSLFKQLIRQSQPQKAAPQVAAAGTGTMHRAEGATHKADSATPNVQSPTPAPQARLKVSGIGMSWKNLREMAKPKKMNILPGTQGVAQSEENTAFSQDDLELQWLAMCNRMPQRNASLIGIATRMKNMTPTITEMPQVEVVVGNEMVRDEMERIRGSIVATLRQNLHNGGITLNLRVAEQQEQQKILSRREQFDLMRETNPSVEKLREVFDLQLA